MQEKINTLMKEMNAFKKEFYYREEVLSEMFELQKEMVTLVFGKQDEYSKLRIWDIEDNFRERNEALGNPFPDELLEFEADSKEFCTTLKGMIAGEKGERQTGYALEKVSGKKVILKNIELYDGIRRTEIDALILSPGNISIIEVKNSTKNIFIDESGNYYRIGKYNRLDCNILQKLRTKEEMVSRILEKNGIKKMSVKSFLVFTNEETEVKNLNTYITPCFLGQLHSLINQETKDIPMTQSGLEYIAERITKEEIKGLFPFHFDVDKYKYEFAKLLAGFESLEAKEIVPKKKIIIRPMTSLPKQEALPQREQSADTNVEIKETEIKETKSETIAEERKETNPETDLNTNQETFTTNHKTFGNYLKEAAIIAIPAVATISGIAISGLFRRTHL